MGGRPVRAGVCTNLTATDGSGLAAPRQPHPVPVGDQAPLAWETIGTVRKFSSKLFSVFGSARCEPNPCAFGRCTYVRRSMEPSNELVTSKTRFLPGQCPGPALKGTSAGALRAVPSSQSCGANAWGCATESASR